MATVRARPTSSRGSQAHPPWSLPPILLRLLGAGALFMVVLVAHAQPPKLGPSQMSQDLEFLRDVWGPKDVSFTPKTRATFNRIVDNLIKRASTLTPVDFSLGILRAVASSGNGHTSARLDPYFHGLPFRAVWFSDGLFIVRTHPTRVALLGARIDKLGSLTPEEAFARVSPYLSGNLRWKRVLSPNYLRLIEVLQHIGATKSADSIALQVTLKDGTAQTVALGPTPSRDPEDLPPFQQLIRLETPLPKELRARIHGAWSPHWPDVLDTLPTVPIAFQRSEILRSAWLPDAPDVLYIQSDEIKAPDPGESPNPITEILSKRPRAVIFDLRFNSGGDFTQSFLFTQVLPRIMEGRRIYVLVGPGHSRQQSSRHRCSKPVVAGRWSLLAGPWETTTGFGRRPEH